MTKQNKIILAAVAVVAVLGVGVLTFTKAGTQGSNLTGYLNLNAQKVSTEPAANTLTPINRAETAKLLVTKAGITLVDVNRAKNLPKFSDVDPSNPYYVYIETAVVKNIMTAYKDPNGNLSGIFGTTDLVRRSEFAKLVVNTFHLVINTANGPHFKDVSENTWFYSFVETLYHWSVVKPDANGNFNAADTMTKLEADTWTTKALNPVAKN